MTDARRARKRNQKKTKWRREESTRAENEVAIVEQIGLPVFT